LAIQGLITWHYGPLTLPFPHFLPTSGIELAGVHIQYGQIITVLVGLGLSGGLFVLLQKTEIGAAMRGVVDDPALIALTGRRPSVVRATSWMIGSGFAALSGVLLASSLGRDVFLLTLLVVQAFGAAAIGRFKSLPMTYAGGVATGVLAAITTKVVSGSTSSVLNGLPTSVPFLVLFAVLVFIPKGRLPVQRSGRIRAAETTVVGTKLRVAGMLATLAAAVVVPFSVGPRLPVFINALIFLVIFLSLGLLLWTSGQLSLCHAVFVAIGATTFSHLTTGAGLPWGVALLLAGVAAMPVGALIAVPAVRLSGIYLALATFGFGVLMQRVVFTTGAMFGGGTGSGTRAAPRPDFPLLGGRTDREFYFVCLVVALLAAAGLLGILRSRLGRVLRALADSPTALTVHGLSTNTTRLLVFSLSAFLAGVAGALTISLTGQVRAQSFGPFESLTWLAVLALSGTAVLRSPVTAALVLAVLPSYAPEGFTDYQTMLFGALAISAAVLGGMVVRGTSPRIIDRLSLSPLRERVSELARPSGDLAEAGGMT
jgi:ABC-type branched-subunit amino acid transport system permease subunit